VETSKHSILVALSGPLAAGKTTIAKYLSDVFDFRVVSSREILASELLAAGTPVTRKSLQDLGQHVQENRGRLWMTEQFLAVAQTGPTVIDAVRHVCSDEFLLEKLGERYHRIHVDAPEDVRRARFAIRENADPAAYDSAGAHPVERDLASLGQTAKTVIDNRGTTKELAGLLTGLASVWLHDRVPVTLQIALEVIADFHRKHGFEIGGGTAETLRGRLPLLLEELGEIARWTTRGGGDISEEHADVLILLLGNAVAMGIDLEEAFVKKAGRILQRKARQVQGMKRVSHWGQKDSPVATRLDRLRLQESLFTETKPEGASASQLMLPWRDLGKGEVDT
jgi:NTP pyrophosphatase (non-canonical NTP hydrolase)/dephospho-CoA kinase